MGFSEGVLAGAKGCSGHSEVSVGDFGDKSWCLSASFLLKVFTAFGWLAAALGDAGYILWVFSSRTSTSSSRRTQIFTKVQLVLQGLLPVKGLHRGEQNE